VLSDVKALVSGSKRWASLTAAQTSRQAFGAGQMLVE
jgi:hypothetical protein